MKSWGNVINENGIIDYNKKGLPVRMVLDEFIGIETEYTFRY